MPDKENEEEEEEAEALEDIAESQRKLQRLSVKSQPYIDGERVKVSDSDKISENSKICVDLVAGQVGGGWQDLVEREMASVANELGVSCTWCSGAW